MVGSLAKPGGNATGVSLLTPELSGKRLELLRQLVPRARRIGYLRNPSNPIASRLFIEANQAARALGVQLVAVDARDTREVEAALRALPERKLDAFVVSGDILFLKERAGIASAIRAAKLPTLFSTREDVQHGAVMSYGWSRKEAMRSIARYVDRILKGTRPGELPVEQVSKFELVINLPIARQLGIDVPQDLLLQADEVLR
jgi:putative ABC transport system substrate-binding protein